MKPYHRLTLPGLLFIFFVNVSYAADGDFDTSFNGNGYRWTSADGLAGHSSAAVQLIRQVDGKLIVASQDYDAYGSLVFALARYNSDGTFDRNLFSVDKSGVVHLQPDGKILILSTLSTPIYRDGASYAHYDCVLTRYHQDGSLDLDFNGTGNVQFTLANSAFGCVGRDILQDANGKLVLAVSDNWTGWGDHIALRRYNLDGSLDASFNGSGILEFGQLGTPHATGTQPGDDINDIIQQPDGKLVFLGSAYFQDTGNINVVMRLHPDGTRDNSFDEDGLARLPPDLSVTSAGFAARFILQQKDGKFVLAGQRFMVGATNRYDAAAVRLNNNGSLDTTFNGSGNVRVHLADDTGLQMVSILQQKDGKLLAGASVFPSGSTIRTALLRLNRDGTIDQVFGAAGVKILDMGIKPTCCAQYVQPRFRTMIRQPDGRLLLAGDDTSSNKFGVNLSRVLLNSDRDTDGDDYADTIDAFPDDPSEWLDSDSDGMGDNGDAFPNDSSEWLDSDGDGMGDNSDDLPLDASETLDTDGDGTGNNADSDDDGDSYADTEDAYPLNPYKWKFPSCDFDGDSDSDILVRDLVTGLWKIFNVQAAVVTSNVTIGIPDDVYTQHMAALDSDGDGDKDILTRNSSTGLWTLYEVDAGNTVAAYPLALYANANWQVTATGDFNGDAVEDVLLRDSAGGSYRTFLLGNHAVAQVKYFNGWLSSQSVDQGVGDFDGDGTDDLLVRRSSDNLYFIYRVQDGNVASISCLCNLWKNPDWTFQFASDMNADGTSDIVIRGTGASADGKWWRFQINNKVATNTAYFNLYFNKDKVKLGAVGDYNGDGTNDVILRVDDATTYVAPVANGLVSGHSRIGNFGAGEAIEQ